MQHASVFGEQNDSANQKFMRVLLARAFHVSLKLDFMVVGDGVGGSAQPVKVEGAGELRHKVGDWLLPPQRACWQWGG